MTNAFGQVSQIFPGLDHMMDYYNAFQFLELHELRTVSSDVTVLVRDDIGDRSSFAANGGIQWGESAIFVRQEFALQKFEIMHAIGHMVGCSHKISESEIWNSKMGCSTSYKSYSQIKPIDQNQFKTM